MMAAFFAATISAVVEFGPAGTSFGLRARSCVERGHFHVADVIAVRMAQKHDMNVAEPGVVAARDGLTRVVEDAHARRIFEYRRAVAVAEFARVRAERRDFHVLRPARNGEKYQAE